MTSACCGRLARCSRRRPTRRCRRSRVAPAWGSGSLYRRYPSRDALVARSAWTPCCGSRSRLAWRSIAPRSYPWGAFVGVHDRGARGGGRSADRRPGGTFTPDDELLAAGGRLRDAGASCSRPSRAPAPCGPTSRLRTSRLLFAQLRAVRHVDEARALALRRRNLELDAAGLPCKRRCTASGARPRLVGSRRVRHPPGRDPPLAGLLTDTAQAAAVSGSAVAER